LLTIGAKEVLDSLVYLDTRDDALGLQYVNKLNASVGLLVEGLLEENNARDIVLNACVCACVVKVVC